MLHAAAIGAYEPIRASGTPYRAYPPGRWRRGSRAPRPIPGNQKGLMTAGPRRRQTREQL